MRLHVLPSIGSIPIDELDQRDIQRALEPIWHSKAETARKALARIGIVIQHAMAAGLDVDAQATAKAKALLGAQEDRTKNIDALPWVDVPAFYESLAEPTITHLALRFLILTGLRSKPVRFLHVDHIDGDVLTVPAELMKGTKARKQEFRVPLSKEALAVIELARPFSKDGFLFPSQRRGVISDATMSRYMDRRGMAERPHGFRTSLRTWFAEATDVPQELAKATLSHVDGSKVDRAYRSTELLPENRALT